MDLAVLVPLAATAGAAGDEDDDGTDEVGDGGADDEPDGRAEAGVGGVRVAVDLAADDDEAGKVNGEVDDGEEEAGDGDDGGDEAEEAGLEGEEEGDEGDASGDGVEEEGVGEAAGGPLGGTADVDAGDAVDLVAGAVADSRTMARAAGKMSVLRFSEPTARGRTKCIVREVGVGAEESLPITSRAVAPGSVVKVVNGTVGTVEVHPEEVDAVHSRW